MNTPTSPDDSSEIVNHYNRYNEAERLTHDLGLIEWERSRELYLRFLPLAPATVVDIGGANGEYTYEPLLGPRLLGIGRKPTGKQAKQI